MFLWLSLSLSLPRLPSLCLSKINKFKNIFKKDFNSAAGFVSVEEKAEASLILKYWTMIFPGKNTACFRMQT